MSSFVIRGGTVVDGTGVPGRRADVRVRDDRIIEVEPSLHVDSDETELDASGAIVAPGFIDTHTHFDPSVFWDPACDPMLLHGVTTILIGNCSLGLAPVRASDRVTLIDAFSFIEDIPANVFDTQVPFDWDTYQSYARSMRDIRLGPNVAALVGHSPLRMYVLGEEAWERSSTADESRLIAGELDRALAAGAFGLSVSLFDHDSNGRPVPSTLAADDEFDQLFATVGRHRGVVEVIPRHPDATDVVADHQRFARWAHRYGVPVLTNAVSEMAKDPNWANSVMECAHRLQDDGAPVYPLCSPRPTELVINFDRTIAFMSLPAWNSWVQTAPEQKRALLADADWRQSARANWDTLDSLMFPTDRLDLIRVLTVGRRDLERFVNQSFADIVAQRGGHPSDVLADWLIDNDLATQMLYPVAGVNVDRVAELLRDPATVISASDAGAHTNMFCAAGDSTLLLTRHVRDRGDLTIEQAVHELTGRQAQLFGFADRGVITPNAAADITVFDLNELSWDLEIMVNDVPGGLSRFRRPPGGYRHTLVNGEIVDTSGEWPGTLPGRFLGPSDRRCA